MYSLLESKVEIASAHRKLEAAIRHSFKGKATTNIGYPGGTERDAKVITDGSHWFWSADHQPGQTPNPRRLNWFGLMPQAGGTGVEISVEINTPYEGKNNQIGGLPLPFRPGRRGHQGRLERALPDLDRPPPG
jgi:hypothetical protein